MIQDILGYGSKAQKNLKEKFAEQVGVCLENLKLENYNAMVLNAIQGAINSELKNRIEEVVKNGVLNHISILEKKEYRLSEIVAMLAKDVLDDLDYGDEVEMTVIVEKSNFSFTYIYLDKEEHKARYECKYRIALHKENVSSCTPVAHPEKGGYGFESFLFALYANQAKVIIDDYNTYVSRCSD